MKEPIRAESQLLVGGTLTSTEALDRSQRTCLAYWLKETYLNELKMPPAKYVCRGHLLCASGKTGQTSHWAAK